MNQALFWTIFEMIWIAAHIAAMQEAYYLKPVNWYILVWLFDLTFFGFGIFNLFIVVKALLASKQARGEA